MRLRSRQVICRIGSTPLLTRKCAAARLDMWAFDPAPSVTLIAVTSLRSASARAMNSAGSVETGGEKAGGTSRKAPPPGGFCLRLERPPLLHLLVHTHSPVPPRLLGRPTPH